MSIEKIAGNVVHYPKRRNVFEFDAEVSDIFPDMAKRSIPMYEEAHRLHVSLLKDTLSKDHVIVYDVGASRGHFFKEICNQLQIPIETGSSSFNFTAIDMSPFMLNRLSIEMPWVHTLEADAKNLVTMPAQADVICMFYILQFLQEDKDKAKLLDWAYESLREGGVLILGQKDEPTDTYSKQFASEYYDFRRANGYSDEEIEAKTVALRNSMWPSSPAWLESMCYGAKFKDYVETTRWLQFSTSMCTK